MDDQSVRIQFFLWMLFLLAFAAELWLCLTARKAEGIRRGIRLFLLPALLTAAFLYSVLASVWPGILPYPSVFADAAGSLVVLPGAAVGAFVFGFLMAGAWSGVLAGGLIRLVRRMTDRS